MGKLKIGAGGPSVAKAETEFGSISESLRLRAPETDFERGLRRFGEMLIRVTLVFVIAITVERAMYLFKLSQWIFRE